MPNSMDVSFDRLLFIMPRSFCVRVAAAIMMLAIPNTLWSQGAKPNTDGVDRPAVFILKSSDLDEEVRARLYIRPGHYPSVVIVLPKSGSTAEDLAAAFRAVVRMHKKVKSGDAAGPDGAVLRSDLTGKQGNRKLSDAEYDAYRGYLASLEKGPVVDLPGIGRGRVLTVTMPDW